MENVFFFLTGMLYLHGHEGATTVCLPLLFVIPFWELTMAFNIQQNIYDICSSIYFISFAQCSEFFYVMCSTANLDVRFNEAIAFKLIYEHCMTQKNDFSNVISYILDRLLDCKHDF